MDKQKVYNYLKNLNVEYETITHEPVFTCEQANKHFWHIKEWKTKNLFLRNDKWNKHFLLTVKDDRKIDLKTVWKDLWVWRLSFASEDRLKKHLWILPWSVSPLALINISPESNMLFILDKELAESEYVYLHPNINTETLKISNKDFIKYLDSLNLEYFIHNFWS